MSGQNKNSSGAFGSYDRVNQLKDVTPDMWQPISTGAARSAQGQPTQQKTAKTAKTADRKKSAKKPSSSKNKSSVKPSGRTPHGRDMRQESSVRDGKRQVHYSESLSREREEYNRQRSEGKSHDEISKNRTAVKRRRLRWDRVITVAVPLVFAIVFIAFFCYNNGAIVENIRIEGNTGVYTAEQIQSAAGVTKGVNMLSLRERTVKKQLTTELPYIKDVKMSFDLPDTVYLKVSLTQDRYVIKSDNSWLFLDKDGKVLSDKKKELINGVFLVDGFFYQDFSTGQTYEPEGENIKRYELMQDFIETVEKEGTIKTAVINVRDLSNVYMIYDGRIALYFGKCENLSKRMENACQTLLKVKDIDGKAYIDVRYDDRCYYKQGSMAF